MESKWFYRWNFYLHLIFSYRKDVKQSGIFAVFYMIIFFYRTFRESGENAQVKNHPLIYFSFVVYGLFTNWTSKQLNYFVINFAGSYVWNYVYFGNLNKCRALYIYHSLLTRTTTYNTNVLLLAFVKSFKRKFSLNPSNMHI